jgi:hypothetical protein
MLVLVPISHQVKAIRKSLKTLNHQLRYMLKNRNYLSKTHIKIESNTGQRQAGVRPINFPKRAREGISSCPNDSERP